MEETFKMFRAMFVFPFLFCFLLFIFIFIFIFGSTKCKVSSMRAPHAPSSAAQSFPRDGAKERMTLDVAHSTSS